LRGTRHNARSSNRARKEAPKAGFAINLWAIAEWAGFPSPFSLDFWQKQVALSKAVVDEHGLLGPECGVVFSLDNYYRSLALSCYDDAGLQPELYPLSSDVRALHGCGVRPIIGWPYFLVDECDDGFITPNNVATGGGQLTFQGGQSQWYVTGQNNGDQNYFSWGDGSFGCGTMASASKRNTRSEYLAFSSACTRGTNTPGPG